jgi:hypothetical protein
LADSPHLSLWFWELLESSNRSLRALCRKLEELPQELLLRYHLEYEEAKEYVNPCFREEYYPYLRDGCSEDHGDDFSAWVVMQGKEFFENVLAHPEDAQKYLDEFSEHEMRRANPELRWDEEVDREEFRGYQRADCIAAPIYQIRFGEDLDDACFDHHD